MRFCRRDLALLSSALLLFFAQGFSQDTFPGSQRNKTYRVEGAVVNSITGKPVPRALVRLQQWGRAMLTGPDGNFSFDDVPAGAADLEVTKPGFLRPGRRATDYPFNGGGPPYHVTVGSESSNVILKLAPEAVIFGVVLGSDGDPLEGVQLHVLISRIEEGRRELVSGPRDSITDEDGNFRIGGLASGHYYLVVQAGGLSRLILRTKSTQTNETYPPIIYFPSSTDIAGAEPVDLVAGQRFEANLSLKMVPGFRVAGTILNNGVQLNPPTLGDQVQGGMIGPDRFDARTGAFEFQFVPAGTYSLRFGGWSQDGRSSFVDRKLVVQSNLTGLNLIVQKGVDIPIVVHTEFVHEIPRRTCSSGSSSGEVRVSDCSDYPAAALDLRSLDAPHLQLNSDFGPMKETYGVRGVAPGSYAVHAHAMFGGYIQSLRCGAVDLLRDPLVVPDGGTPDAIEVVVRDDPATLDVKLRTERPGQEIVVLVFPDPLTKTEPQFHQNIEGPEVYVPSLPPGDYKVFAVNADDDFDYSSLETLQKYASQATSVKVGANENATVVVDLIHTGE